jgi:hypothetical protein
MKYSKGPENGVTFSENDNQKLTPFDDNPRIPSYKIVFSKDEQRGWALKRGRLSSWWKYSCYFLNFCYTFSRAFLMFYSSYDR